MQYSLVQVSNEVIMIYGFANYTHFISAFASGAMRNKEFS